MRSSAILILSAAALFAAACGRMGDPLPPGQARVGTPQGLVAGGREDGLTIGWSLPSRTLSGAGGDISGFLVEVASVEKGKEECQSCSFEYEEAATIKALPDGAVYSWTDKGARPGETRNYRVFALDGRGNRGLPSPPVAATYFKVAPPSVELFPVDGGAKVKYSLPASAIAYEGISAYDGAGKVLARFAPESSEGRIAGLKNGEAARLSFRSSAVSPQGWRIESEEVALEVTPKDSEPPEPPLELALFGEPGGIRLMWMAPSGEPYAKIVIKRGKSPDALEKIAEVPGGETSFLDSAIEAGVTYFYGCTAMDEEGNESAPSPIKSAAASKKQP